MSTEPLFYSQLYANDASVYEQIPAEVSFPENVQDCIAYTNKARELGQGLICRGGGTSIAGQCVGSGVVVDFSRHMANILSSVEDGTVWVQPGVVLDDLNDFLRPLGWQFPIDISTSSSCTIGGMVGNNAAGSHSIVYGTTRDNVLTVDAILADGTTARFGPVDAQFLQEKLRLGNAEGDIYRKVVGLINENRDAILATYPDVSVIRRNTGYALDVLARGRPWVADGPELNLAALICGSEGTLALVTSIELALSPLVGGKALLCVHFDSVEAALRANIELLDQPGIAASELIDDKVLRAAASHPGQQVHAGWVMGEPGAVLAAEFFGNSAEEAQENAERAASRLKAQGVGTAWPVLQGDEASHVWALRKAGLGLIMGLRQRARPVAVIEDSAVPVQSLAMFASDISTMMRGHGIDCVYYGHASVGLLHLRPALDLDNEKDLAVFRAVAQEMAELVKRYRGALSGEHGDGRLRAPFLREFLGDDVYAMLQEVKRAFDPCNILNPGKILSELPVDSNVRSRPHSAPNGLANGFDWSVEGGFDLVLERCNGTGSCRQHAGRGGMCPTFQASGSELHSTRGRANLLRQAYKHPDRKVLKDAVLAEAMATCLGCKACQSECPSGVDMARMKSEFLYHRRLMGGIWQPMRWLIATQPLLLSVFTAMPAWIRMLGGALLRMRLVMRLLGLERKPPMAAAVPLVRRTAVSGGAMREPEGEEGQALLVLIDPLINQLEPEVGEAVISLLRRLGYFPCVHVMDCSLRLLVSEGFLDEGREGLRRLCQVLNDHDGAIIGIEPSELLLLRDEALSLMDGAYAGMQDRLFLLHEFLLHEHVGGRLQGRNLSSESGRIAIHPHCHERAAGSDVLMQQMFSKVFGLQTDIISTGCCGMGGRFGYGHRELSGTIFRNNVRLAPDFDHASPIVTSGVSCRQQFMQMADTRPLHVAQYLEILLSNSQGTVV